MAGAPPTDVVAPRGAAPAANVAGAFWLSGLRCVVVYVVLPVVGPFVGVFALAALPVVVALHALGTWASARATWRSWRSERLGLALLSAALLSLNLLGVAALLG